MNKPNVKGHLKNTFRQDYVPENPGAFLETLRALQNKAIQWALAITPIYNLDLTRGEYVHEVLPPSEAKTPGRRALALTVQFYSFDSPEKLAATQELLRRKALAARIGYEEDGDQRAGE